MIELTCVFIGILSLFSGLMFWFGYFYGYNEHKQSSDYFLKRLFGDLDY